MSRTYRPKLSHEGLAPTHAVTAIDQYSDQREVRVAGESPLTLKVNDREIVTLMTLGTHPEELALGYLRNQRLLENINDIESVNVNWDKEVVNIVTIAGKEITDWEEKLKNRTVTSGCGQGTVFSCTLDKLYDAKPPEYLLSSRCTLWRCIKVNLISAMINQKCATFCSGNHDNSKILS